MHPHLTHQIADQDRRSALQQVTPTHRRRVRSLRRRWTRATGSSARAAHASGEPARRRSPPAGDRAPRPRRGFRTLWLSSGASNLADGILFAGLPVLAVQVTDSPALVSGVAVALMLPMALAALPSGVVADRYERRQVLVAANALRVVGIAAVLVAVVAGELGLAAIYAVAAIAGSSEMLADTTAQTAVPALVESDQLESANARLGGTQVVMNDAVGAPIGSFLAGAGAALALGVPAVLFAIATVVVRRLPLAPRPPATTHGSAPTVAQLRADVRDGVRYLAGHDLLRRLSVANAASNLGNTAFFAVFVVFVVGPLDLPASTYGWFLAAVAFGGVVGSLIAGSVIRALGHSRTVKTASVLVIACYLAAASTSDWRVVGACITLLGAISLVWNVTSRVLRQTIVPDPLLGRVTSTMAFISIVSSPIGGLLGGVVAEAFGVRAAGIVAVSANVVALVLLRPIRGDAIAAAREHAASIDEVVLDEPQLSASPSSR